VGGAQAVELPIYIRLWLWALVAKALADLIEIAQVDIVELFTSREQTIKGLYLSLASS
jgi:hypothetical protein